MNLEVLAWAPDQQTFWDAMTAAIVPADGLPLASYDKDDMGTGEIIEPRRLVYHAGLNVSEVGEIVDTPAVYGPEGPMGGPPITPAVMVPGWHANLRFHEPLAEALTYSLVQTDPETGALLPLFERTLFTTLFPDAVWHDAEDGVPAGYMGTGGLKLFDPADVKTRSNTWA